MGSSHEILRSGVPGHDAAIQIVDMLYQVERGESWRSPWEVFTDFLETMYAAWTGDNEKYMELIGKYSKESISLFAKCGAVMDREFIGNGFQDILGLVYMDMDMQNERSGQYFTPFEIAYMTAKMVIGDTPKDDKNTPITFCEPCIGSGTMVLAAMKAVWEISPQYFWRWRWYGQDIDRRCVLMSAIQINKIQWFHSPFGLEVLHGQMEGRIDAVQATIINCLLRGVEPHGIPVPDKARDFVKTLRMVAKMNAILNQPVFTEPESKVLLSPDEKAHAEFQADPSPAKFNNKGQGELF